jgi:hypothetical protein
MTTQRGWCTPRAPMVQMPILKRDSAMMVIADKDSVFASARLLIASATEFVPRDTLNGIVTAFLLFTGR